MDAVVWLRAETGVSVPGQWAICYFLQLIYMYCAFLCIHNLSINVYMYAQKQCHALCVSSTILHWLHVETVEAGMTWTRYECGIECHIVLPPSNPPTHHMHT